MGEEVAAVVKDIATWGALVLLVGLTVAVIYVVVKDNLTRKEPTNTTGQVIERSYSLFVRTESILGGIIGAILTLAAMVFGLYLFLVLIKFLWARA